MNRIALCLLSTLGGFAVLVAACNPAGNRVSDVEVLQVYDGDSFAVDTGGERVEVRILGINAPEHDECFGADARELLVGLLGGTVDLEPVGTDRFGRTLARVEANGVDVGAAQVSAGAALTRSGDDVYTRDLIARENDARTAGVGMWSPTACGATPPVPRVEVTGLSPDPPGRDEEHLNDEWVEFTAFEHLDLSGWVLRDESSSNRFRFPPGTILHAEETLRVVTGCEPPHGALGWCAPNPVWNNRGDSVLLLDDRGRVVAHRRYRGT